MPNVSAQSVHTSSSLPCGIISHWPKGGDALALVLLIIHGSDHT